MFNGSTPAYRRSISAILNSAPTTDNHIMMQEHDEVAPDRVIKSGLGPSWLTYVWIILALAGLGLGLWYALAPESMARIYGTLADEDLVVHNLVLTVDRQTVELPPNATMEIHPGQSFAVAGLNTNRPLNYDLSLSSPDFDIMAVADGASATPADLLPNESFERPRTITIEVREGDRELAEFKILSRYTALDFAARGDAAVDPALKADFYQKALGLDSSSQVVRDKLLAALDQAGQNDRAAEIYEQELAENGPDETRLTRLLDLYRTMNQVPKQVEVLGRLADLARSRGRPVTPYLRQLAALYKEGGRPDRAAEVYEALIGGAPANEAAVYLGELVGLYRALDDPEREISTLKRLVEVAPAQEAPGIWSEIVTLYDRSGDQEGLVNAWKTLSGLLPEGEGKVNAYKMTAQLQAKAGHPDQAALTYQAALKMAPEDVNILHNLARLAAGQDQRAEYRSYLESAVNLDPENIDLRRELAEALKDDKQNTKARAQYLELLKRRPDDTALRLTLIDLLESLNDRASKAALIEQYEILQRQNPGDKIIAFNYAVLLYEARDWTRAIEAFKKVLAIDPDDLEVRDFLLISYQNKGQQKEMLAEALELYRQDPSKDVYKTLMLNTYENAKNWAGYAQVAEAVTKAEPNSPSGWELLARAQGRLNKKAEQAESLWEAAERTDSSKKVAAWFTAARAFEALKNYDQSLAAYQKVLELEPENDQAAKAVLSINLKKAKGGA